MYVCMYESVEQKLLSEVGRVYMYVCMYVRMYV